MSGSDKTPASQTQLLIDISHWKDLPADLTDMVANRVYTLLFSRGVEVGVDVKLAQVVTEQAA